MQLYELKNGFMRIKKKTMSSPHNNETLILFSVEFTAGKREEDIAEEYDFSLGKKVANWLEVGIYNTFEDAKAFVDNKLAFDSLVIVSTEVL